MKKTKKRPSAPECTHELMMTFDPAKIDLNEIAAIWQRLHAVGVRLTRVAAVPTSPGEQRKI